MKLMKKLIPCLLVCMLALTAVLGASAENTVSGNDVLAQLNGQTMTFSSGVGAWSTELQFGENGSFSGLYHDSEMGEDAEEYPNGTVYGCLFHGTLSDPVQVDANTWKLHVSLTADEGQVPETIEDGIRYVTTDPYGLKDGQDVILYLPGTPVAGLPEELLFWTHLREYDANYTELPFHVIWNESGESGFVGEMPGTMVGMMNPWAEVSAEELAERTGCRFGLPEGAEDVRCFVLNGGEMAEMQFTLNGCRLTARIAAAAAFTDISGMYYAWTSTEAFNVAQCPAVIWTAPAEEGQAQVCLWYDAVPGLMYSVSACGDACPDLKTVAEALYIPVQAEAE